jgi:hypothetical protein
MKILSSSTEKQKIKVIPRTYPERIVVTIRNEQTNETTEIGSFLDGYAYYTRVIDNLGIYEENDCMLDVVYLYDKGYMIIRDIFNLVENTYYNLTITDGTDVIYRDKIFCTNQEIDQDTNSYYSVNKDVYKEETSYDNDYIII